MMQFQTTYREDSPKTYYYIDCKRVSQDVYEYNELKCRTFDCLRSTLKNGVIRQYKQGRV